MITAIGMIKNSADVIETYIRANSSVVDNFVLLNNLCTDRTIEILNKLIEEGYNIEIIPDNEMGYYQGGKMTALAQYTCKKYKPDFIIPLDDDEILAADCDIDIKNYIMQLDRHNVYYLNWRVYVPTEEDNESIICVARQQNYCFSDKLPTERKVIIPSLICNSEDFKIVQGNHAALSSLVHDNILIQDIFMAHFPCRSLGQMISKCLVGWTSYLLSGVKSNSAFGKQWYYLYSKVKNGEEITFSDRWLFCTFYLKSTSIDDLEVSFKPINLPEDSFKIQYTSPNEVNALKNYIENTELIISQYLSLREK